MINFAEVAETNAMIDRENLDVRTITMGISLLDCADSDLTRFREKIYEKITMSARNLVKTGEEITKEYGIPIVNKRISITPIAIAGGGACRCSDDYVTVAKTLDRAAKEVGVNFLGGYSALVSKGMTQADRMLIESIPDALSQTDVVCSSVNVGSTRTGIDMDAVRLMGGVIKRTAERTADRDSFGCAKLVVFCNAPDDNPFMAGAFHGVTEADRILNIGVSGPGVVKRARGLQKAGRPLWHHRPVPGAYTGCRRQRGGYPVRDGPRERGRARYDGSSCPPQRPGQKGRCHGLLLCRRPVRRFHSGQ